MRTVAALAALAALIAACTPMHWERVGSGLAATAADERECRTQAAHDAWFYGLAGDPFYFDRPRFVRGRAGRLYAVYEPPPRSLLRQQFAEQRLFDRCMENRGFRLVPDAKALGNS
jgi:hypothetical protein